MAQAKNPGQCVCGCGATVKRRFLPGHDQALLSSLCGRVSRDEITTTRAQELASRVSPQFARRVAESLVMVEATKQRDRIRADGQIAA